MINSLIELVFYVNLNSKKEYSQKTVRILKRVLKKKQITETNFKPISKQRAERWIARTKNDILFGEKIIANIKLLKKKTFALMICQNERDNVLILTNGEKINVPYIDSLGAAIRTVAYIMIEERKTRKQIEK